MPEPAPVSVPPAPLPSAPLPTAPEDGEGRRDATAYPVLSGTVSGAALLLLCEAAGSVFVAAAVALGVFVLLWGWPAVVGSPEPAGTRLAIAVAAAAAYLSGALDPAGLEVRQLPVAIAAGLVAGFLAQLVRGDIHAGVVAALTAGGAGIALVAAGLAYAPLPESRYADRPVAAAMAGIVASLVVDLLPARMRGLRLLAACLLGAAGGAVAGGLLVPGADLLVAGLLGLAAGVVSLAVRITLGELPGARLHSAPPVIAAASLLAPGLLVYTFARLLLG